MALLLTITSCGSKKQIVYKKAPPQKPKVKTSKPYDKPISMHDRMQAYAVQYSEIAQEEMKQFKIPASITLAQGLLESQAGVGQLAQKANNHFGIKCHREWNGKKVYHDDDAKGECFRKYKNPHESYRDHSLFLANRDRYSSLFRLRKNDYESWAHGLKKAGYATDPRYAYKLISLIERYELWRYDGGKSQPIVSTVHVVQKGDTLYSLSKKYRVSVDKLKSLNKLKTTNIQIGQTLQLE